MRKFGLGLVAVLAVGLGVAIAEEFGANITKIDGDKIEAVKKKKGVKEGEKVTLNVAKDVKVFQGKFEDKKVVKGDAVEGGLKGIKIGDKGAGARITTNADGAVTEIVLNPKKKKAAN